MMRKPIVALVLILGASAWAQHGGSGHSGHSATPSKSGAPAEAEWNEGEVRRVDRETGRVTLRHGHIHSLDMPPMTMVFQVANPALLEGLKATDKVKFKVLNLGGKFTITALEPVR